jgi:hypothetical protein
MADSKSDNISAAVKLIETEYMDVAEMRDTLHLKSYQYARQFVVTNRYGLGASSIEVMGRTFVSRAAVKSALETRKARQAEASKADAKA